MVFPFFYRLQPRFRNGGVQLFGAGEDAIPQVFLAHLPPWLFGGIQLRRLRGQCLRRYIGRIR
jgi:hypothetical protein